VYFGFVFFFSSRRRHTRSKRDWSSDVCSSDLALREKVVISLATNTYCCDLSRILPEAHCVATAPNTPVSVCEGIFICEEENTLRSEERRVGKERRRWRERQ